MSRSGMRSSRTCFGPNARTASAAQTPESTPPETPSTAPRRPSWRTASRMPVARALVVASRSRARGSVAVGAVTFPTLPATGRPRDPAPGQEARHRLSVRTGGGRGGGRKPGSGPHIPGLTRRAACTERRWPANGHVVRGPDPGRGSDRSPRSATLGVRPRVAARARLAGGPGEGVGGASKRRPMATRRKTATARRAPARTSRPARKRAAGARRKPARKQAREPLLSPHQYRDLAGLALCALAAFSVLVLWAGAGGGSVGGALRSGLELLVGPRRRRRPDRARRARREPAAARRRPPAAPVPRRRRPALARRALAARLRRSRPPRAAPRRRLRRQRHARRRGGRRGRARRARARRLRRSSPACCCSPAPPPTSCSATAPRRRAARPQGVVRVAATVRSVPLPADMPAAARRKRTPTSASRRSTSSSASRTSSSARPSRS